MKTRFWIRSISAASLLAIALSIPAHAEEESGKTAESYQAIETLPASVEASVEKAAGAGEHDAEKASVAKEKEEWPEAAPTSSEVSEPAAAEESAPAEEAVPNAVSAPNAAAEKIVESGLVHDERGTRYIDADGTAAKNRWVEADKNWYYFGADTYALRGVQAIGKQL